jgi:hypothetical protein
MRTSGLRGGADAGVGAGGALAGGADASALAPADVVREGVALVPGVSESGVPAVGSGAEPSFGAGRRGGRLPVVGERRMLVDTKPVLLAPDPAGLP